MIFHIDGTKDFGNNRWLWQCYLPNQNPCISMDEKLKKLIFLDAEKTAYVDLPILCTVTIVIFPNRWIHVLNAIQVPRPAKDVK